METRIGDYIQTYSGIKFWPLDPRPEEILVADIAHSLANQCRFSGHTISFLSVAQHCILVSEMQTTHHDQIWGLLHDASEAYLVDLPRPIKRFSKLGEEYLKIESRIMEVICGKFNLDIGMPSAVKMADDILLMTERRDLMTPTDDVWFESAKPMNRKIVPVYPQSAEKLFLDRAKELDLI